jgi:hypothetical protein
MGMGRERGRGWGSVYKQPGTRVDRDHTTRKGGIPSKLEGLGKRGGFFMQEGDYQWDSSRGYQGDCAMCSHIMSTLYISCYCVYVMLIKGCV